jgi:uncharacterized protein YjbI with pentapeptide repeats
MQTKNFSGQNLRGRSFKNQDLVGMDFSDCDLRGVDFSGADLTRAKFCNARMGRTLKVGFGFLLLQLLLGVVGSMLATLGNVLTVILIQTSLYLFTANSEENQLIFSVSYALLVVMVTIIAVNRQRWDYVAWVFVLITPVAIVTSEFGVMTVAERIVEVVVITTITTAIAVTGAGVVAIAGAGAGAIAIIVDVTNVAIVAAGISLTTVLGKIISKADMAAFEAIRVTIEAGGLATIVYIALGIYFGWRARTKEEPQLLFLRDLSVKMNCLGGTQFALANLHDVDFANADLKYARFKNAKMNGCCFQQAKNHHLALTVHTPLELRKVRDLVIGGIITDQDFSHLNLRGLVFSGLDLQGFDFSHADLCSADLSHTKMTGTTIESWNFDTETRLDDIDCQYYYYLEDGEKKRMPSEGEEFKVGEFTQIFQKIANTIDFLAHNEIELAAIKLSVEQVRVESGNDEIRIQAIEEKDGIIVVKVYAPKNEDRGVLYHEVNSLKQDYETKIQILMSEKYAEIGGFQSNIEILKEQLREQRQALLTAVQPQNFIQIEHHQGEIIMGDKNINTNITGSTIQGSVVTAEKVENSFNTVQQSSDTQNELKELLSQLQNLINNSTLPEPTKQKALSKTQDIAEATKQPEEEQKNIVQKTLGYFEGLTDSLESIPETAIKLGETVAKIGILFGL